MPKKIFTPEQIVAKLREIEVALANGKSVSLACRDAGIVDASYYRWRKEWDPGSIPADEPANEIKYLKSSSILCDRDYTRETNAYFISRTGVSSEFANTFL